MPGSERNTKRTDEALQLTAPGNEAEMQFSHHPPSLRHWRQRHLCLVNQNICLLKLRSRSLFTIIMTSEFPAFMMQVALLGPGCTTECAFHLIKKKALLSWGQGWGTLNPSTLAEDPQSFCLWNHTDPSVNGSRQVGKCNSVLQ